MHQDVLPRHPVFMTTFRNRLRQMNPTRVGSRRWIFIPYDQLTAEFGPLRDLPPAELGLVFIETRWKAGRRPYHKQKLALILANMRHFALEQAARGVYVDYRMGDAPYSQILSQVISERGHLEVMEPAEYELRRDLRDLVDNGMLRVIPHEGWLTSRDDFLSGAGATPPWRMDAFYRHIRRQHNILMDDRGKPIGGRFSFDGENRKPWKGTPAAPTYPTFTPDEITTEVIALIHNAFAHHPGTVRAELLPTTEAQAEALWAWALTECLPTFGPYEDAMSTESRGLFHTKISPLMNLHRLTPKRIVSDVLAADIDLPSKEGFVRQVLGWREFVHHIHATTDGFRCIDGHTQPGRDVPGDAGYQDYTGRPFPTRDEGNCDGGSLVNRQNQTNPVPPAFWGRPSGLHCLDTVVESVWDEGYSHHITRLMVLANLGMLLDLSPRDLTDWFWVAYIDAYDWVVEPNVLGMGMYASDCMTTKPYIAGSGYLRKMSNYCTACEFNPKTNCPLTPMYWAWLGRHGETVHHLQRMRMPLASLRKRADEKKRADRAIFHYVSETLASAERLQPAHVDSLLLGGER